MRRPTGAESGDGRVAVHALSFDVEDWFHVLGVEELERTNLWTSLSLTSSLVERNTDLILDVCARAGVKATFFVLGWIAQRYPALVKRIADAGHDLGSHSFWHRPVYSLTPEAFAQDLADSLDAIRTAVGRDLPIEGFRAPSFSIVPGTEWAFDVLVDAGIAYDASLFPARRGHGGYPGVVGPQVVTTPRHRQLAELPMSTASFQLATVRRSFCYSGGGYLRLLPWKMITAGVEQETAAGRPTVLYLHPRDFAPGARTPSLPIRQALQARVGIGGTRRKLEHLLESYSWEPCRVVLEAEGLLCTSDADCRPSTARAAAQVESTRGRSAP